MVNALCDAEYLTIVEKPCKLPRMDDLRATMLLAEPDRPPEMGPAESLGIIRRTMERAAAFSAIPGWGTVLMGFTALAAAARWSATWT